MLQSDHILLKRNIATVGTWHPHVYSNPPKKPTAYFVADILGLDSSHRPKQLSLLSSGVLTSGGLNRLPKTESVADHRGRSQTHSSTSISSNASNLGKNLDQGRNNSETKVNNSSKGVKKAKSKGGRDKKKKKARTTFTGRQIFELENMFEEKKYLTAQERSEMATLLNVTETQVKIWFQNRRTKWKKMEKAQQEIENNEHGIDKERGESNSDEEDDEGSSCDDTRVQEEGDSEEMFNNTMNRNQNKDNTANDNIDDTESNSDTNTT